MLPLAVPANAPASNSCHPSIVSHTTALHPPPPSWAPCWSCVQGFLQLAPKSAVAKLKGAVAAAEYSSPRPTPKGGPTGAHIIASSATRLHHQ